MALPRKKKKILIITASIAGILIILLISLNSILSRQADSYICEQLVMADSAGYHVEYSDIKINIFNGTVKVYDIRIRPMEDALAKVKEDPQSKPVFEVSIDRIKLARIALLKAMKGEEFNVGAVSIDKPDITVYSHYPIFHKKSKEEKSAKSVFSSDTIAETQFKEAFLGSFSIEEGHFKWVSMSSDTIVAETRGLNLEVDDICVHHPEGDTLSHVLDVDDIEIELLSHFMDLPGDFYSVHTGELSVDYSNKELRFDSVRIVPAYSKEKFAHVVGKQTDRFDLNISSLHISGLEFDSIFNKKVIIKKIMIDKPRADIYRDKRIARDMSQFPKLFQTALAEAPIQIDVEEVEIKEAFLDYQERLQESSTSGSVMFNPLNIHIKGIKNAPELIEQGQVMTLDAEGMFLGKGETQIHFDLPVGDANEKFSYYGSMGSIAAKDMNPMIEPLVLIAANEGTINGVKFYGRAEKDTIVGRLELLYNNLKVTVLKKQKQNQSNMRESWMLSAVATIGLVKNNPSHKKPVRISRMFFVRDHNKGFFNYIWKAVQSGLIHTLDPRKKNHIKDMEWASFETDWYNILEQDRKNLPHKKGKKKK